MKTFEERMRSIRMKGQQEQKKIRSRRILAGSLAGVFTIALALVLFVPYSTALPDVSRYSDSPYYHVIQGLNEAIYQPPRYKNNYEFLASQLSGLKYLGFDGVNGEDFFGPAPGTMDILSGVMDQSNKVDHGAPMPNAPMDVPEEADPAGKYEEVTDNQVEGVIEADLFKRSDRYLFYLNDNELLIYSIAQANTALAGSFQMDVFDDFGKAAATEMYLSQDCSTITVLMDSFTKQDGSLVTLVTLDVSDPANIIKTGALSFKGSYISSRMVGNDILLTYNYGISKNDIDFEDPETFIPQYGTPGDMVLLPAEDIFCAEDVSSARYTVIAKLDAKTLELKDTAALLSYSQELYVSEDTIYATNSFTKKTEEALNSYTGVTMTEITGISYAGAGLEVLGSVQIEGSVRDQYSMDQHNGTLRVAASTIERQYKQYTNGNIASSDISATERNCSLYCIDLPTWQIIASVEKFAPAGDEVTSARFDGDMAYICTAEVIVLTDPVYFFDLSDLNNITWTDTGIIDGYSSSLVNFGDYLLGIGFGEAGELKLEAYREGQNGVESIGIYERQSSFPNKYKAYLIDRENNLVGMPVLDWMTGDEMYILLHFDGYQFREFMTIPMEYFAINNTRATLIDGWLYLLYGDCFAVEQAW